MKLNAWRLQSHILFPQGGLMSLRSRLRRSMFHIPWRKFRDFQKLKRFNAVLDTHVKPAQGLMSYPNDILRTELAALAPHRKIIKTDLAIWAFGTNDWEAYGFWSSFSEFGSFNLFDYKVEMKALGFSLPSHTCRKALENRFLDTLDALKSYPELVFLYANARYISPSLLEALSSRGIWTVLMGLDDKQMFMRADVDGMVIGQETLVGKVDLYWTTWRSGVGAIRASGGRPWYQPEAADPKFYKPLGIERDLDVVFVGAAYGSRLETIKYLRSRGFSVSAFGSGWGNGMVSHGEMVTLFNRAKVVLGVGSVGNSSNLKHLKARDFEVPMCGSLYLTSYNSELCDHYEVGNEILCYSSREECAEMLFWLSANSQVCEKIRENGYIRAVQHHTWSHRIGDLLRLLSNQ